MSHSTYIHAVKISLGYNIEFGSQAQRESLGIYEDEIRWVEYPITTTPAYVSGVISMGGISSISQSAPIENGGCVAESPTISVMVENASQKIYRLKEFGITLDGKQIQIVEFTSSTATEDTFTSEVVFTGYIDSTTWTDDTMTLNCANASIGKRNAQLGTQYDEKTVSPVTFGSINFAKLQTVPYEEIPLSNRDLFPGGSYYSEDPIYNFPFVDASDEARLEFRINNGCSWLPKRDYDSELIGKYVKIIEGKAKGQYRKITDTAMYADADLLTFVTKSYFTEMPVGNGFGTDADQTWCSIVDIDIKYVLDGFKCGGIKDVDGDVSQSLFDLYAYDESAGFVLISNSTSTYVDSDNNKVQFDSEYFYTDPYTVVNRMVYKPSEITVAKQTTDYKYGNYQFDTLAPFSIDGDLDTYSYKEDGLYSRDDTTFPDPSDYDFDAASTYPIANMTDNDSTTFSRVKFQYTGSYSANNLRICLGYFFKFPKLPADFQFDSCHLLILSNIDGLPIDTDIILRASRWFGVPEITCFQSTDTYHNISIRDFYDDYYSGTYNDLYYFVQNTFDSSTTLIHGYKNFEYTKIKTVDDFNAITCFCAMIRCADNERTLSSNAEFDINELAIMFLKQTSIKDKVFANVSGRIYNDSWATRYGDVSTDMMHDPIAYIEHAKRLANWSELGVTGVDFGHEYTTGALIKTSGLGNFDDASLAEIKALAAARQITDEKEQGSDAITRSICEEFFLVNWIDESGYECIADPLALQYDVTPADAAHKVAITDLIPDSLGEVREPIASNIYTEPYVVYNYNYGSEVYDSKIAILKPWEPTFSWDYVVGLTASDVSLGESVPDGQHLWNKARALWLRSHNTEQPPTSLTECKWIRTVGPATWKINRWLDYMTLRSVSFAVGYEKGRSWGFCKHITINLPHYTNGTEIECVIKSISKSKDGNRVEVTVLLLEEVYTQNYANAIQDTCETVSSKIQDTDDTVASNIQNIKTDEA